MTTTQRPRAEDEVELRIPACSAQLPVARTVAASIAIGADFDVHRIEDARLLTDELCAILLHHAQQGAVLLCRFRVDSEVLRVHGSVLRADTDDNGTGPLSWRMLHAIADSVSAWDEADAGDGAAVLHIEAIESAEIERDRFEQR